MIEALIANFPMREVEALPRSIEQQMLFALDPAL